MLVTDAAAGLGREESANSAGPIGRIGWKGGREIWVYVSDSVTGDIDSMLNAIALAATERGNLGLLESALRTVAGERGLELRSFVSDPDHADPLGVRITVGFGQPAEQGGLFFGKLGR